MAVDKKSQHVGNHGGRYTDLDGQSRQFTYIDHDKKSKMSTYIEEGNASENFRKLLNRFIDQILALPAAAIVEGWLADDYELYVTRNREKGIQWREEMVREAIKINPDLMYSMWNRVWKNTVREQYWFEEISYEDILAGKWKEWV